MEVTLYMPYYDYNDGAFNVNGDYYKSDDYVNAMTKEYNMHKDVVFNSVMKAQNGSGSLVTGVDGQTYKYGARTSQSEDKVAYSSCNGKLYNENGEEETVDSLISHFVGQKQFIEMVEFDDSTSEEEFISEISLWVKEHNSINKYKDFKGEEWAWMNEPKRNVKMHFKNNANEDLYAILENCKIMDIVDDRSMIVLVEKFRLIDGISE